MSIVPLFSLCMTWIFCAQIGMAASTEWRVDILQEDASGITLQFELSDYSLQDGAVLVEGLTSAALPGQPQLPMWSGLFAVPGETGLELEVLAEQIETRRGVEIHAAPEWQSDRLPGDFESDVTLQVQPDRLSFDHVIFEADASWPLNPATMDAPALWHGVRVCGVQINPFSWNPRSQELTLRRSLMVRLSFTGTSVLARQTPEDALRRRANRHLVASSVMNPHAVHTLIQAAENEAQSQDSQRTETPALGSYLVIAPDAAITYLTPWLEWKQQMGHPLRLILESDLGGEPDFDDLKNAIEIANHEQAVDFVLLVGDIDRYPSGTEQDYNLDAGFIEGGQYAETQWGSRCSTPYCIVSDHEFSLIEGDDYFSDLLVGRLSVDNANQLATIVAKWIDYEKRPYVGDENWFHEGLVIYDVAGAGSRRETKWAARDMLYEIGYTEVDTVRNHYWSNPQPPSLISAIVNDGVSIVNYRGYGFRSQWAGPNLGVNHANSLSNVGRWPLVTSIVCGGGDYASSGSDPCFGEAWLRSGSPSEPAGAIAFIAPSEEDTHTKWNNAIDLGIYQGLSREGLLGMGELMDRGKFELWRVYPNARSWGTPTYNVPFYFHAYNLLGDPGMQLRTTTPQVLNTDLPTYLPAGPLSLCLSLQSDAELLSGSVIACLWNENTGEQVLSTCDAGGQVCFGGAELHEHHSWVLTLYGEGLLPIFATLPVVSVETNPLPQSFEIQGGTVDDGHFSPGERISLAITFLEAGSAGVDIERPIGISTNAEELLLHQTASLLPALASGETIQLSFDIEMLPEAAVTLGNGALLPIDINIDGQWVGRIDLEVASLDFTLLDVRFDGDDGMPAGPGATGELLVTLESNTPLACESYSCCMIPDPRGISMEDPCIANFELEAGASIILEFVDIIFSQDLVPGEEATVTLEFEAFEYELALAVQSSGSIVAGTPTESDPAGPDAFGHLLFENLDSDWSEAPESGFESIEDVGQEIVVTDSPQSQWDEGNDGITRVVDLPFSFRYWGEDFFFLSICTNGWVAFGEWLHMYTSENTPIPAAQGPPAMIAAYWTDLYNYQGNRFGHLYTWHDEEHHRFIVEWNNFRGVTGSGYATFQLELRDPEFWSGEGIDGEILIRYDEVPNSTTDNAFTIGFESPDETTGLELYFNNDVHPAMHSSLEGTVLRYMMRDGGVDVAMGDRPDGTALHGIWPNPFNPTTTLEFSLEQAAQVELHVFNLLGQEVRQLVNERRAAGSHRVQFHGLDLESGLYIAQLKVDGKPVESRKMMLLK